MSARADQAKPATTYHKIPTRPKTNEAPRANSRHNETKRRRQEDHFFVPNSKQLLHSHNSNNSKSPDTLHALENTSTTNNPSHDPHVPSHVFEAASTPHTHQSLIDLADTSTLDKTILALSSQNDMHDDTLVSDDKTEATNDPPLSSEEDMVT